jgi:hypothetical protein
LKARKKLFNRNVCLSELFRGEGTNLTVYMSSKRDNADIEETES